MLNEVTVAKVAKALGIPEEKDDFLGAWAQANDFVGYGGIEMDAIVSWLVANGKEWKDVAEEAAKALVEELELNLDAATVVMCTAMKDLEDAKTISDIIITSEVINEKAKKAEDLQNRINSICKDFPNANWTKNHIE